MINPKEIDMPMAPRQMEFVMNSNRQWNLAHGSVRSGKTVCTLFRFMQACYECPDSQIFMVGHSSETIYQNAVRLLLESDQLAVFRPFCTWQPGKRTLKFFDKNITILGAKDEGAIGAFQGKTFSLVYCDEMTLYPTSIIDMIDTRLSNPHSMGFASMNPAHPSHKIKEWIDMAEDGNPNYYSLHFTLDHNPYVSESYKDRIRQSLSGLFYKRNYLGLWCLAEGAIFDFFDRSIHVLPRPPKAAEYWIAGIDYGTANNFACVLIGISSGKYDQTGVCRWIEKEYVWDSKKQGRQKTNAEYARDVEAFLEPYGVKCIYMDPSAASFKIELQRKGMHVVPANNNVSDGIAYMMSEMSEGNLFICEDCPVTISEIESYVWDHRKAEQGIDAPVKKDDHCFASGTKVLTIDGYKNIETIVKGDLVKTRSGFNKVLETFNHQAEVKTYNILGKNIRCTPSHLFLTIDGWRKADDLIQSDILITDLSSEKWSKKLDLIESYTDVIQTLKERVIKDISELEKLIVLKDLDISIETFGSTIMEKYHKDTIFITKTEISQTTTLAISNAYHLVTTFPCMQTILQKSKESLEKKTWIESDLSLKNGTKVKLEGNGTQDTHTNQSLEEKYLHINASNAPKNTNQSHREMDQNFVRITVKVNGEETIILTMNKENACFAENFFLSTSTPKQKTVKDLVVQSKEGLTDVFNLHVENEHEFFVEGILVHNCLDALRYAIFTHKVVGQTEYQHNPNEYLRNKYQITRNI